MLRREKWTRWAAIVIVAGMVLSACATPTPEVIEKIVTKEVEKIITQVVKETVKETVIVGGTPQVVEKEVTRIVEVKVTAEPTPAPAWFIPEHAGRYGGILHVAYSTPPTLDTHITSASATGLPAHHWIETLVAYDYDYQLAPMLAESWEVSDDKLTVTFYLRKGILFHNGKEMTAEDVDASFTRYMTPGVGSRQNMYSALESWEAIDDYTFVMHLSEPSMGPVRALASPVSQLGIMPKEIIEGKAAGELKHPEGYDPDMNHDIIGTGPYKVVEWKPDEYLRLQRFEGYQPRSEPRSGLAGAKISYLDEIYIHFVMDASVRVAGIETGDYDWVYSVPSSEYERLQEAPGVYVYRREWTNRVLHFNQAAWPTSDVRFRRALVVGLDHEALALTNVGGLAEAIKLQPSYFNEESPVYTMPDEKYVEMYYANDPEWGKELLAEMGYNGEEVTVLSVATSGSTYDYMVALADQMGKRLDISVNFLTMDWPTTLAAAQKREGWHIFPSGYTSTPLFDVEALASYWYPGSTASEAGFYDNPEMGEALDRALAAFTPEERKAGFAEAQRIYYEDHNQFKPFQYTGFDARTNDIEGHRLWYDNMRYWDIWFER